MGIPKQLVQLQCPLFKPSIIRISALLI